MSITIQTASSDIQVAHKNLDSVSIFRLEFHIWSGKKKLEAQDLKVNPEELPPEQLTSLGVKKIINPALLKPFEAIKKAAHRLCSTYGISFMDGFAVPLSKVDKLCDQLRELQEEFAKEKDIFISAYSDQVEQWIKEQGEWGEIIRKDVTEKGYVESKISFDWEAFRIAPPMKNEKDTAGLVRKVGTMADSLFDEIATAATEVIDKSLQGRDKVSQKCLATVRKIRNKLHDLAFLDEHVSPIVTMMDYALDSYPKSGPLEGVNYLSLRCLMDLLADTQVAKEHGKRVLEGKAVGNVFSDAVMSKRSLASEKSPTHPVAPAPITNIVASLYA